MKQLHCAQYLLLLLSASQLAAAQMTAITNVTVIDPASGKVEASRTVLLSGKQIQAVQKATDPLPAGARQINGKGKYLIPGLWDSHVHLSKAGRGSLPLFVANGVTSVRDMGSDLSEMQAWRSAMQAGTLLGPQIKTAGQILESRSNVERMKREATIEPVDRIRMPLANPEEARKAVATLVANGADHIKMRTTPDDATFLAVADECRRRNVPFTAHSLAPLEEMIQARLSSVEHFAGLPPFDSLTAAQRRTLFGSMAQAGLFMSTTLANVYGSMLISYADSKKRMDDAQGKLDPFRRYVCGYLVADWKEQVEEKKDSPYDAFQKVLPGLFRDLREMRESGVKFLAGTDVAVAFMYPGFSLHDELENLVKLVGFSPMEALRTATYHPAVFYGEQKKHGSIAAGQAADLVLLDENPLTDIRNTRKIAGVMVQGRWLDRKAIRALLQQAERDAKGRCSAEATMSSPQL